ncbi:CAAX amino terminal protease family [Rubidibacter lacunae KORDI 51-2]|uniref:CAAX amino terminal protease family n=1 Tax=Rubidibacter lacunae KORDI 51-2 TaxID=582515 RepID=U5DFV0_9CHRO|nr:type II CAAX endopeptidase family protein [Rubidibacter lacunae]ERN40476.1 CAAX amino terminal protease family [Rubidibacter lacunae KORDI 51-2]
MRPRRPLALQVARLPAPLRVGTFLLGVALGWMPLALPIYLLVPDANLASILGTGWLFVAFLIWLQVWNRWVYRRSLPLARYGWRWDKASGRAFVGGFGVGAVAVLALFGLQALLGWRSLQVPTAPTLSLWRATVEGAIVAVAVGTAEELLFRGWLLDELERDYQPPLALALDAGLFAIAHFLKPWAEIVRTLPQFPGLILLGMLLVYAKRRSGGHLGLAIGLHAGLVWGYYLVAVGELAGAPRAAPWLVGIDNNPLASALGWLGLSSLVVWMRPQPGSPDAGT